MTNRKPLVLGDDVGIQRLQPQDDLDIPLEERVNELEIKLKLLCEMLALNGIELPEEIIG